MQDTKQYYYNIEPYRRTLESIVTDVNGDLVRLDKTIFYPAGGGQPCDNGEFFTSSNTILVVINVFRDRIDSDVIWHQVVGDIELLHIGLTILGNLNWARRYNHMRMHTCLHLLTFVIDAPVMGCDISEGKGRLDFDLPNPDSFSLDYITRNLNILIEQNIPVSSKLHTHYDSEQQNTQHLSPYNKSSSSSINIRLVSIGKINTQPCGGTHLNSTIEVGKVICTKIKKVSKHNRRIYIEFSS